jgi:hypothetical protein
VDGREYLSVEDVAVVQLFVEDERVVIVVNVKADLVQGVHHGLYTEKQTQQHIVSDGTAIPQLEGEDGWVRSGCDLA